MKFSIASACRKYQLTEKELACILLYIVTGNKSFSWSQTVGIDNMSANGAILAGQWFNRQSVKDYIIDNDKEDLELIQNRSVAENVTKEVIKEKDKTNLQDEVKKTFGIIEDVTSENIKQLFINELNYSTDPEKRASLLLKLSDTLELITPEETDLQTPTIYLPSRCQTCLKH